jgi:hypothetical protein
MPCIRELFIALVSSFIFIFLLSQKLSARRTRPPQHGLATKSLATLTSIAALLHPPLTAVQELLQERASANNRLADTLNLTNAFVDADLGIHDKFVQISRRLLKDAQSSFGWNRLQDICSYAVELSLDEYRSVILSHADEDIPFDHFVQVVVLRAILVGLLNIGKDVDELDIRSLGSVTTGINRLWTLSKSQDKGSEETSSMTSSLSDDLQFHLRQMIPPESGFDNPIDFVVPTWETMWRVCATIIARIQEDRSYEEVFQEFLHAEEQAGQKFNAPIGRHGFSVRDFVVESMRLNPPVKRISRIGNYTTPSTFSNFFYRIFSPRNSPDIPLRAVANIEAVLLDPEIWSEDTHVFNPRRHRKLSMTQRSKQMQADALKLVFGYGPLRCVAASWAPKAVAVIAATIVGQIHEAGLKVISGDRIGGRSGWDGWKITKSLS